MRDGLKSKSHINLLAFPSETRTRFVVLMVCCLLLIWDLSDQLIGAFPDILFNGDRAKLQELIDEYSLEDRDFYTIYGQVITREDISYLISEGKQSFQIMLLGIRNSIDTLVAPSLFSILCVVFYLFFPALVRFGYKLKRLDPSDDADFYNRMNLLSAKVGIAKCPIIEVDKRITADAQVFGAIPPMHIRVSRGLRILLRKKEEWFNVIALHELSHILNKDVASTYLAIIAWDLSLSVAIAWLIIATYLALSSGGGLEYFWRWIFGFTFMFGFIRYNLQNVLKTREFYADWRVAMLGLKDELRQVLESNLTTSRSFWRNLIAYHPSIEERVENLHSTSKLMSIKNDLFISVGVLLGFLISILYLVENNLRFVEGALADGITDLFAAQVLRVGSMVDFPTNFKLALVNTTVKSLDLVFYYFIFLVIALFIAATIGIQVQRYTINLLSQGRANIRTLFKLFLPALIFGSGVELGSFLSINSYFWFTPDSSIPLYLTVIFSVVFLAFTFWLWTIWIYLISRALYSSFRTSHFPQKWFFAITVISGVLLSPLIHFHYTARSNMLGVIAAFLPTSIYDNDVVGVSPLRFQAISYLLFFLVTLLISWLSLWAINAFNKLRSSTCPFCKGHILNKVHAIVCSECGRVPLPWLFIKSPSRSDDA